MEVAKQAYRRKPAILSMIISNYAETLEKYGEEKDALKYYKEALVVLENIPASSIGARIILLKKIAELSLKFHDIDEAMNNIKVAKQLIENTVDILQDIPKHFKERILYIMAICYIKNGEAQRAFDILEKIRIELEKSKVKLPLLSDVYYEMAQILRKKDSKNALSYIEKGISTSSGIFGPGNYSTKRFVILKEILQKER